LHFSFRKTYWKIARPFRTYPCMTTRSRWTIFKCSGIVLLRDVISSSILWCMKQMHGESPYQAL
jgi:hypothetical protein